MLCPSCGAPVARGLAECPQCGAAVFAKDRAGQAIYQQSPDKRKHEEDMFTARYVQQRYGLSPQAEGESDSAFCKRVNDNKTAGVLRELNTMVVQAGTAMVAREPGEEG